MKQQRLIFEGIRSLHAGRLQRPEWIHAAPGAAFVRLLSFDGFLLCHAVMQRTLFLPGWSIAQIEL